MESYIAWIENVLIIMPNMVGTIIDHEDVLASPEDIATEQWYKGTIKISIAHRLLHSIKANNLNTLFLNGATFLIATL